MKNLKVCNVDASMLVEGYNFPVYGVSDPEAPEDNTVIFVKSRLYNYDNLQNAIVITKQDLNLDASNCVIVDEQPKNKFAEILQKIVSLMPLENAEFADGSYVCRKAKIGKNTHIGKFCIIEDDVQIGDNCHIGDYVKICAHTRIGNNVKIYDRCSIGIPDADIYRKDDEECMTLPHLAGTVIEGGSLLLEGSTVCGGDTRTTRIGRGALLSLGAHVGHNSILGDKSMLGAYAHICGHCDIGKEVYIAPGAMITSRIIVGDKANIGLSSAVLQNIGENKKVFGNPAFDMPDFKKK